MTFSEQPQHFNRRSFLQRSGMGFGSLALAGLMGDSSFAGQENTHFPGKAKHVIHVFLNGGMSQVDTFDPKPRIDKTGRSDVAI